MSIQFQFNFLLAIFMTINIGFINSEIHLEVFDNILKVDKVLEQQFLIKLGHSIMARYVLF